ncbi:XdhC family protein [Alteromonas gilva]|uniref:XdhC family protein n=1 Tax=Alteromonas gilva TaxID=2987522 RepID=A0ABT5L1R0_9ALTE|nr:XdhC family protein [Alteromonas gilva]MDC8830818.1 XdhC family protein [Alteromonas gilva]
MQPLDVKVLTRVNEWLSQGKSFWFCTVLATWGSSPREPGSLFAAVSATEWVGSLSGGCVEDDFLSRIANNEFNQPVQVVRYGEESPQASITLPCGGILDVLVEKIAPSEFTARHFGGYLHCLLGHNTRVRQVNTLTGEVNFTEVLHNTPAVNWQADAQRVELRTGPARRLIIAGYSPVADYCARFAISLGFEVILCEHRSQEQTLCNIDGCRFEPVFAADYLLQPGSVHSHTAVVALTHDPRVDDLTMMEAVTTDAFYIGVMGSKRTSANRAERLQRVGQLSATQLARIHMPVGLDIGSKTPAEIGLAVMADIVKAYRKPVPATA